MRLFILGAAHTLGRQQPEQHREFLVRFEDRSWLELFARPHSEWETDELLRLLRRYVDDLVEDERYVYWMRLFIPLFQVSHHLGEYIELLLNADQDLGENQMPFDRYVNPAKNSDYSGGGLRPARVGAALGIGVHFVLREMARTGLLLTHEKAKEHCIVPRVRVLRLMQALGCDVRGETWHLSRVIATFLQERLGERWHFDRSFDIALYALASDPERQREFFGRELELNMMGDDE
jgi:hypothetical protein